MNSNTWEDDAYSSKFLFGDHELVITRTFDHYYLGLYKKAINHRLGMSMPRMFYVLKSKTIEDAKVESIKLLVE